MKRDLIIAVLVLAILLGASALSGCTTTSSGGQATTPAAASKAAPAGGSSMGPTLTTEGNVIRITGDLTGTSSKFGLNQGAYVVKYTVTKGMGIDFKIKTADGTLVRAVDLPTASGSGLISVSSENLAPGMGMTKPGDHVVEVISGSGYTIEIYNPDVSTAVALPQTVEYQMDNNGVSWVTSGQFTATAGTLKASYTWSKPDVLSTIWVYKVSDGKLVMMGSMTKQSGEITSTLEGPGEYIAMITVDKGPGSGRVTFSQ